MRIGIGWRIAFVLTFVVGIVVVATRWPSQPGSIVVAAVPLEFGAELTGDNITEIPWPAANLPEGAFASKTELLKDGRRTVLKPLEKSEPVLRGNITGPGQRASLSSFLGDGRKAVTIRVDDVKGVAGFVWPGDHVDVFLIRSDKGDSYFDILAQHVKVLASDQLANERQEKAKLVRAVTLDVTTEQAQKIVLASTVGRLSLILRRAARAKQKSGQFGADDVYRTRRYIDGFCPHERPFCWETRP